MSTHNTAGTAVASLGGHKVGGSIVEEFWSAAADENDTEKIG